MANNLRDIWRNKVLQKILPEQPSSNLIPEVREWQSFQIDEYVRLDFSETLRNQDFGHDILNALYRELLALEKRYDSEFSETLSSFINILDLPEMEQAKLLAQIFWLHGNYVHADEVAPSDGPVRRFPDDYGITGKDLKDFVRVLEEAACALAERVTSCSDEDSLKIIHGISREVPIWYHHDYREYGRGLSGQYPKTMIKVLAGICGERPMSPLRARALRWLIDHIQDPEIWFSFGRKCSEHPSAWHLDVLDVLFEIFPMAKNESRLLNAMQWFQQRADSIREKVLDSKSVTVADFMRFLLNEHAAPIKIAGTPVKSPEDKEQAFRRLKEAKQPFLEASSAERAAYYVELYEIFRTLLSEEYTLSLNPHLPDEIQSNETRPSVLEENYIVKREAIVWFLRNFLEQLRDKQLDFSEQHSRMLLEKLVGDYNLEGLLKIITHIDRSARKNHGQNLLPELEKLQTHVERIIDQGYYDNAGKRQHQRLVRKIADLTTYIKHADNNNDKTDAISHRNVTDKKLVEYLDKVEHALRGHNWQQATLFTVEAMTLYPVSSMSADTIVSKIERVQKALSSSRFVHAAQLSQILDRHRRYASLRPEIMSVWGALEYHSRDLDGKSKPSNKWLKEAATLATPCNLEDLARELKALVNQENPEGHIGNISESALKGLIWMAADWPHEDLGPALTEFAQKVCYVTVPMHGGHTRGIRSEKLGNAVLWYLIHLPDGAGVPYLARLLARVKYPKVKKKINQALNEAAEAAGISRGALDEMSVPTHGLDADGRGAFPVGDGAALVAIIGTAKTETKWRTPDGKVTKSVPAALKDHKDAIKDIRKTVKEIEADLATQIPRLQGLYLDDRRWPSAQWVARYADHPLMSQLSRRLIWNAHHGEARTPGLWRDGAFQDITGQPVDLEGAEISLWHPLDGAGEALAWRDRLQDLAMVQPFKQAHREVYVVTDAERTTGTYSNRFAGHILKQHQAMTLARINNWKVTHRIWADVENDDPWHRVILAHGLIAEYWAEGAGGDDPEVTDSQAYLYVSTDQARFYAINPDGDARGSKYDAPRGAPVAMADVPPLVFSEIMRQLDLFVGVASIANDPGWADGGADALHPNQWRRNQAEGYWQRQSFADLSASGDSRRELLEKLLPVLAIGDRCQLDDKFLRVRGTGRWTYKIHLGSGNILMEPGDRYLCIVPAQAKPGDRQAAKVHLPFEGDRTLSLILSKAFLLAADNKITDPVILRQIEV